MRLRISFLRFNTIVRIVQKRRLQCVIVILVHGRTRGRVLRQTCFGSNVDLSNQTAVETYPMPRPTLCAPCATFAPSIWASAASF